MRLFACILVVGVAACSDSGPGQSGPIVAFKDVHPILTSKCSQCHLVGSPQGGALGFLSADSGQEYETAIDSVFLVGDFTVNGSPILSMIDAEHHQNIMYTDDEHKKLRAWLDAETTTRYGTDLDTASGLADAAVKQWSGCLTMADFMTAGMVNAWTTFTTVDGRHCTDCHDGQGNLPLAVSSDPNVYYAAITKHRRLMVEYFVLGSSADQVVIDTHSFDVTGNRKGPHVNHPMYVLNAGYTALKMWFDLAAGHRTAGSCGPPQLVD